MKPTEEQIDAVARARAGGVWGDIGEGARAELLYTARVNIEAWERVKEEQRQADEANRERVIGEMVDDLWEFGIVYSTAEDLATDIASGKVRNVKVVW